MSLIFPPLVGLLLALSLTQKIFGRNSLRAIFYLPVIIAPIAVATMWKWMYDPFFGLFSQMLTSWGMQTWIKDWLGNKDIALYSVFIAYLWQTVGFSMVLFLAGLQNVSQTLVEAARIDGAGRWAVFRYIELPKLRPVLMIAVLLRFMDSFMIYTEPFVLTGGGPGNSTTLLSIDLVKIALGRFDLGPAGAMSLIYFLIVLLLSWIFYTVMTKDEAD